MYQFLTGIAAIPYLVHNPSFFPGPRLQIETKRNTPGVETRIMNQVRNRLTIPGINQSSNFMIVAVAHCDPKGLIGVNGALAYKSREDHQWFKSFTQGKKLVMGRNTYTECGNLANREILCLSSSGNLYNGLPTNHTVESLGEHNVVICGGAKVYQQYLPVCNEVIVNYTKQAEKQPGINSTYFDLAQLNELFTEIQRVEYKTFTQVIYKLHKN